MIVLPYSQYMEEIINTVKNLFVPKHSISSAEDASMAEVALRYTRTGVLLACIPGGRKEGEPKTQGIPPNLTLIQGGQS